MQLYQNIRSQYIGSKYLPPQTRNFVSALLLEPRISLPRMNQQVYEIKLELDKPQLPSTEEIINTHNVQDTQNLIRDIIVYLQLDDTVSLAKLCKAFQIDPRANPKPDDKLENDEERRRMREYMSRQELLDRLSKKLGTMLYVREINSDKDEIKLTKLILNQQVPREQKSKDPLIFTIIRLYCRHKRKLLRLNQRSAEICEDPPSPRSTLVDFKKFRVQPPKPLNPIPVQNYEKDKRQCVCKYWLSCNSQNDIQIIESLRPFDINCIRCSFGFHQKCYNLPKKSQHRQQVLRRTNGFICSYCRIANLSPVHEVIEPLKFQIIGNWRKSHSSHMLFYSTLQQRDQLKNKSTMFGVQLRCVKLQTPYARALEQRYPPFVTVKFNGLEINEFQDTDALHNPQTTILLPSKNVKEQNKILFRLGTSQLVEKRIREVERSGAYLAGIFFVKIVPEDQLIDRIRSRKASRQKSEELFQSYFRRKFLSAQESQFSTVSKVESQDNSTFKVVQQEEEQTVPQIQQRDSKQLYSFDWVYLDLRCKISTFRIEVPVRGTYCEHFQCFDIKSLVRQSNKNYFFQKPWLCPFCGFDAYELEFDELFAEILKNSEGSFVFVDKNGKLRARREPRKRSAKKPAFELTGRNCIVIDEDY